MKELTTEQKAKRFDEVLAIAKECITYVPDEAVNKYMLNMFPELKESEDERIRKMLIEFFGKGAEYNGSTNGISDKEVLAWLEKQGEQNLPLKEIILNVWELGNYWKDLTKGVCNTEHGTQLDYILKHWTEGEHYTKLLEKQGEQEHQYKSRPRYVGEDELLGANKQGEKKPVEENKGVSHKWYICIEGVENFSKGCLYKSNIDDQGTEWITDDTEHSFVYGYYLRYFRPATEEEIPHESKFKVGDWVVYCGKPYKITGLHNDTFTLTSCDGSYFFNNVKSTNEPVFHLWSIADAKDGDVLVASDGSIFLFAGVVDCACKYYVALTICNDVKINKEVDGGYWETSRAVHPATKEQRAILFQKMSDAGYAFDLDKKEMMKIEDLLITGVEIPFGAKDSELEEVFYSIPNGFHAEIEGDKVVIKKGEKKPLSEEDERKLNKIIDIFEEIKVGSKSVYCGDVLELQNWLKFIKERMT